MELTSARGAGTHGGVLNLHTGTFLNVHTPSLPSSNAPHTHAKKKRDKNEGEQEEVTVSSAYQNLPTYGYHVIQRFTTETIGCYPLSSLRISREQHVPDSSNHSLCMSCSVSTILRYTAEGISYWMVRFVFRHQNPSTTNDLHVSIATPLTLPFSSIVHHPSGPDSCALSSQPFSRSLAVASAHVQAFTFIALAPNTTRNTETDTHTQHTTHGDRHRERERERDKDRERQRKKTEKKEREQETHFSSLLHHLPGAVVCVALALKITAKNIYTCTHTYTYTYTYTCRGVTCLLISQEKTQSGTRAFHDVYCSKPLTFHKG